ncbi:MAG TPA: methyltransferase domain-containing protein [Blastocatellia bacterium]|nr:methyltransferase domain-containing protein [Blastocatellia bacterium]
MFASFAERSNEAELIDGADYTAAEYVENLADLRRVNRYLGGRSALTRHLFPMIEAAGLRRVRLLDVGTGSADIPARIVEWAGNRGIEIEFVALDLNEIAVLDARNRTDSYPEIKVVRADAMNLPFDDRSFDFALASLFLHHFENPQAAALLRSFARVARVAFIINDLRRHPVAYYSIKLLTQLFTRNRLVRNDSAVSVLRGFTERDISDLAELSQTELQVFRHFPYRIILVGRRSL